MTKIKVIEIKKFEMPEYVSVEKQLLLEAEKYIKRAEMYLIIGKTRHSLGCLIKAAKKYDKAKDHTLSMDSLADSFMQPIIKTLSDTIASSILNLKV